MFREKEKRGGTDLRRTRADHVYLTKSSEFFRSVVSKDHQRLIPCAEDGKAIDRLTGQKHDKYPELVTSDRVHFVVLACEEGGRWGPDVFEVINDLVRLKVAPLHPLLRRSAALAYTRRWWSILAMGAQSAAIDCIFGRDPEVWVPHRPPPLATVLAEADIAPEPSRVV